MVETPEEIGGRLFFGTRPKNIFEAMAMDVLDTIPIIGTVTALERAEKMRMFGKDVSSTLEIIKSIPIAGLFVAPNTYNYLTETGLLPKIPAGMKLPVPEELMKKGGE